MIDGITSSILPFKLTEEFLYRLTKYKHNRYDDTMLQRCQYSPPPHTYKTEEYFLSHPESPFKQLTMKMWVQQIWKKWRIPFLMTTSQLLLVSLEEKSVSAWVAGLLKHYYENQCPREVPWSDHWVSDNVNNGFGLCNPQTETEGNEYTLLLLLLLHSFLYRFFGRWQELYVA